MFSRPVDSGPMRPYGSSRSCPKCGNEFVTRKYIPHGDYIRRQCEGCGYAWNEAPLDAAEKDATAKDKL